MPSDRTLVFHLLGKEFERRGWLAKRVTVDGFVSTRTYLARLAGLGDADLVRIYGLLCPAVIDRDAGTAAAVEAAFLADPTGLSDGADVDVDDDDGVRAAEAMLAGCLPGILPDGPCREIWDVRRRVPAAADVFTSYGYRCLGPILALFGRWVWRRRRGWERDLGRGPGGGPLVGLLRDGRLLGRAVAAACPEAQGVLREAWLGRRLCLTAALRSAEDREGLRTVLIRARGVPVGVGEALDDLGLTAERDGCPLPAGRLLDAAGFDAFCDWLAGSAARRGELERHCRTLRRAVIGHLGAAGALDGGGIGLVDIGYAANLQRALAIILEAEGRATPLWGAYLITSEGALWTAAAAGPVWGCLAAYGAPSWLSSVWLRARELFEVLLAQPCGALDGYDRSGAAVSGVSPLPAGQLAEIARVQEGALAFVRHWGDRVAEACGDNDDAEESGRLAHGRLIAARMFLLPSPREVRCLGDWLCDDAMALGTPRPLTEPVASAPEAFQAPRTRLLWPAGSAVAHAAATPSELLAAWIACRAGPASYTGEP